MLVRREETGERGKRQRGEKGDRGEAEVMTEQMIRCVGSRVGAVPYTLISGQVVSSEGRDSRKGREERGKRERGEGRK